MPWLRSTHPSLTPSQQAAREFWRQAGTDGMPPFYVMSQYYAQLSANSDNLPAVTAAIEQLLTGLGYATDVDTVFSELTAGQGEELGYWAGRYCLFDSDGNRFDLVVGRDGATLTVPPALVDVRSLPAGTDMASVTVLSSVGFSDGVLQLANANALLPREISLVRLQASLSFSLPVGDASFDTADPAAAMFQSTAPLCKGTFVVSGGGSAGLRPVNGKRGAWTQAGVNQAADGDPAAAWYGQYVLLDVTDVTAVKQDPNPVYIYNDPQYGLTFRWGDGDAAIYGSNVTYNNNVLRCANEKDDRTQYAIQFVAPQAGAAEINLAVKTSGGVRSYKGYWVGSYAPPSLATSQARLANRPLTAVYSAASDVSAGGYSQAIDVSSLTAGGNTTIKLPDGAVGNTYALSLNLTNCATTDKFSWTVSDGVTGGAAIAPGAGATVQFTLPNPSATTRDGQPLQVTVQLTKTSAAPPVTYTLLFEIAVIKCDAISLTPTVLPPVVVGTAYTQSLVAKGANGSFTWSVNSSSLPRGLTWDPSSHKLYGTVTDATQVGMAFSLVIEVTASDVIMDPLTAPLNIAVPSAPAVASSLPPWEKILLYFSVPSLVTMGIIGAAIVDSIKQGKANTKTAETIQVGNTNVEDATGGDPKSTSQTIIQSDTERAEIIKAFVMPYLQKSADDNLLKQETLHNSMAANEVLLQRLTKYKNDHRNDQRNEPVTDPELKADGYKTFGDIEWGIMRSEASNYRDQITSQQLAYDYNDIKAKIASNHDNTNEIDIDEPNNKRLRDYDR